MQVGQRGGVTCMQLCTLHTEASDTGWMICRGANKQGANSKEERNGSNTVWVRHVAVAKRGRTTQQTVCEGLRLLTCPAMREDDAPTARE